MIRTNVVEEVIPGDYFLSSIVLMSAMIISFYTLVRFLDQPKSRHLVLHSLTSVVAPYVRISKTMGDHQRNFDGPVVSC